MYASSKLLNLNVKTGDVKGFSQITDETRSCIWFHPRPNLIHVTSVSVITCSTIITLHTRSKSSGQIKIGTTVDTAPYSEASGFRSFQALLKDRLFSKSYNHPCAGTRVFASSMILFLFIHIFNGIPSIVRLENGLEFPLPSWIHPVIGCSFNKIAEIKFIYFV